MERSQAYIEKQFSIYEACYAYAAEWHAGQWSRSYALLCKLDQKGFHPGLSLQSFGRDALTEEGKALYDHLLAINY